MRAIAARVGMTAANIYNYYQNKDELYLAILTRGFSQLYERFGKAFSKHPDPVGRLKQMGREYLNFGLEQANIYNLMFTWHVPKFKDYVGTPMEPAARTELETALTVSDIFIKAIMTASGDDIMTEDSARFHMISMWSQMHGFIAGINNTLLDYMHENPMGLKERMLDEVHERFLWHIGKNG
jgi:AcrR family transcriptional regulator